VLTATRRALPALALAGVSLAFCGQSLAVGFGPTHMVTLKVTASDHWTRTADLGFAPVGDGTVTFTGRNEPPERSPTPTT
jgi:hypothetical protein